MEIEIEKNLLRITYEKKEWQLLKSKFEELGLTVAETSYGLGNNLKLKYYRDPNDILSMIIEGGVRNDINTCIYDNKPNIAILRIIPVEKEDGKLVTEVKLRRLISVTEFNEIINAIAGIYKKIVETVAKVRVKVTAEITTEKKEGQ